MKNSYQYVVDAICWIIYHLAGIAIPIVISIIVSYAINLMFTLNSVTNGGQFALYSASMSFTTLYLIAKPNPKRLPFTSILALLCWIVFAFALVFFVLAVLRINGTKISEEITKWPTIILFIISAIITFISVYIDFKRIEMNQKDLLAIKESNYQSLNNKFDQT
jgi:hypothetical protein